MSSGTDLRSACGKCKKPSCLECFPFMRPRNPPTPDDPYRKVITAPPTSHSMHIGNPGGPIPDNPYQTVIDFDTDVVKNIKQDANEELHKLREFNLANKIQAPTEDLLTSPENAEFIAKKIMDYAGIIDGGGIKMSMYDNYIDKPPMELVPQALTRACARALGYGAIKYAPNNWRRGMRWGEVFGGLKRHLDAWNEGENIDPKEDGGSGLNHLDHAAACLAFLCHMVADKQYKTMDDRPCDT